MTSNTTGNLIVAYTGDAPESLISDWDTEAQLSLKSNHITAAAAATNHYVALADPSEEQTTAGNANVKVSDPTVGNTGDAVGTVAKYNDAYYIVEQNTPAIEGGLDDLYTPAATFPEINPDAEGYTSLADVNTKWGAALTEGSANYDAVYKLTGDVTTPTSQESEFTADDITVGGALLVEPRATYNITVELGQYLKDKDDNGSGAGDEYYVRYIPVTFPVTTGTETPFAAGTSYKVHVKVYGSEQIVVTTTLQGWTAGGNQVIDTEELGY